MYTKIMSEKVKHERSNKLSNIMNNTNYNDRRSEERARGDRKSPSFSQMTMRSPLTLN